jgi:hypothetical protein
MIELIDSRILRPRYGRILCPAPVQSYFAGWVGRVKQQVEPGANFFEGREVIRKYREKTNL